MTKFRKIEDGIYLGAQPTREDLMEMRNRGIRTVIDFRLPTETATPNEAMVRACGLDYANIPVNKAQLSAEQTDDLAKAMNEKPGPFLVHCATGARAAMLLALAEARKHGWTAERTFEEARRMGFDLQGSPEFSRFIIEATGGNERKG
jgi:uncharacterized protein (TIGR01244 family)